MKSTIQASAAAALLTAALAGCGGGGGGGNDPTAITRDTSIAKASAPAGFGFPGFRAVSRTGRQLVDGVGGFPVADARRTWVSVWYVDDSGRRQQLAFLSLAGLQALDAAGGLSVVVPGGVTSVRYEIYDSANSKAGEVSA